MKKLKLFLVMLALTGALFATTAFAGETIVESPNVKIIIDGVLGDYEDVPLIVDGRTMLPLRAVLTNLGVQNDDQHIIWDSAKRSVTIVTADKTIYLEVGSKTALINGEALSLDVAPMIYAQNNRTYIPARFVAESLGKKVIWDGSTTSVLIRNEETFNEVKTLLEETDAAMLAYKKYKIGMDFDMFMSDETTSSNSKVTADIQMDQVKQSMYMSMLMDMGIIEGVPTTVNVESYTVDKVSYTHMNMMGMDFGWTKTELTEEEVAANFEANGLDAGFDSNDILAAGLVIEDSSSEDEILLTGDIYMDQLLQTALGMSGSTNGVDMADVKMEFDTFHITLVLDRETKVLKSMDMTYAFTMEMEETGTTSISADVAAIYSDYDGDFEVVVPQEVIEAAEDQSNWGNLLTSEE